MTEPIAVDTPAKFSPAPPRPSSLPAAAAGAAAGAAAAAVLPVPVPLPLPKIDSPPKPAAPAAVAPSTTPELPTPAPAPAPHTATGLLARFTRRQLTIGASAVFSLVAGIGAVRLMFPPKDDPKPASPTENWALEQPANRAPAVEPPAPAKPPALDVVHRNSTDPIPPAGIPVAPAMPPFPSPAPSAPSGARPTYIAPAGGALPPPAAVLESDRPKLPVPLVAPTPAPAHSPPAFVPPPPPSFELPPLPTPGVLPVAASDPPKPLVPPPAMPPAPGGGPALPPLPAAPAGPSVPAVPPPGMGAPAVTPPPGMGAPAVTPSPGPAVTPPPGMGVPPPMEFGPITPTPPAGPAPKLPDPAFPALPAPPGGPAVPVVPASPPPAPAPAPAPPGGIGALPPLPGGPSPAPGVLPPVDVTPKTDPKPPPPRLDPMTPGAPAAFTKPGGATDVKPTAATSAPKTDFDVDLYDPKANDSYEAISQEYYNDRRFAAALKAFNRNQPLQGGRMVEVPPIHVLKKRFTGQAGSVTPVGGVPSTAPDWGPAGGKPDAPPARATGSGRGVFVVPQGGMTMKGVARATLGTEQRWQDIWDLNRQLTDPSQVLPAGTELKLPPDARQP